MTRYIVMQAAACMPGSCWGKYSRVAVVELEPDFSGWPKMISERAVGVRRIVQSWERLHVGKTERCAAAKARAAAEELARNLNRAVEDYR